MILSRRSLFLASAGVGAGILISIAILITANKGSNGTDSLTAEARHFLNRIPVRQTTQLASGQITKVDCTDQALRLLRLNSHSVLLRCGKNPTGNSPDMPGSVPSLFPTFPPSAQTTLPPAAATPLPTGSVSTQHPANETGTMSPGSCGEPMDEWHPPVVNGCATGHEHGDAPPSWITDAGFSAKFLGHFNTSDIENTVKHTSMKGFLATLNGTEVYFRTHFASNPQERFGSYHSYEVFAHDPSGGVSHWQGWSYTGKPTSTNDRCLRRKPAQACEGTRPIILVTDDTSLSQGINCEQWYSAPGGPGWSWDYGYTICGSTTVYQPDKEQTATDVFNQSTWKLTGDKGLIRRLEAAWYGPDSKAAPNRGNPPKGKTFWATQFGEIVSGADDPRCSGTTVGRDGQTYDNICLDQYIATTMRAVEFPGNAVQKTFPGTGVKIPN